MKMITILLALFTFACVEEEPYYETGTAYVELYDRGYESTNILYGDVPKKIHCAELNGHDFVVCKYDGTIIRTTIIPTEIELAEGQESYHGFIKFDFYEEIEQGTFTAKRIRGRSTRNKHTVFRGKNLVIDDTYVYNHGFMFDKSEE